MLVLLRNVCGCCRRPQRCSTRFHVQGRGGVEDRFFRLADLEAFLQDGERWDERRRAAMDGATTACDVHGFVQFIVVCLCVDALLMLQVQGKAARRARRMKAMTGAAPSGHEATGRCCVVVCCVVVCCVGVLCGCVLCGGVYRVV